ncbi:MAG: hypothetical protein Q9M36_12450 [Sulfurovum sp.]|nr:hypothetical protein [Sulfurovum sp.]
MKKTLILLSITFLWSSFVYASEVVNVYSHRHYAVDKKLYKRFKQANRNQGQSH